LFHSLARRWAINQSSLSDSAFHATPVPFVGVWMIGCGCDLEGATKRKSTNMNTPTTNINIDIKHKHSGHLVTIEGQTFRANQAGQWDLSEIWSKLKLAKTKRPGQWRTKEAERLSKMHFLHSANVGTVTRVFASKRAVIEYAAWVSPEFKDMVFDAFEAILEMPEVVAIIADKMRELGRSQSAKSLEHQSEKEARREAGRQVSRNRTLSPEQKERKKWSRMAAAEHHKARKAGREWC
jgi:hypothetical protein